MRSRILLRMALLLCGCLSYGTSAMADDYPSKPIKIIVGFAAGGSGDTVARLYGRELSILLKTPVIIENMPSANQLTAIRTLQAAAPDGYTIMSIGASALSMGPAVRSDLGYDPLKAFTFIGLVGEQAGVMIVNPSVPVKNVSEFVSYAKAHPGEMNYSSAGVGSAGHLEALYFSRLTGIKMTHIPYKGDAEAAREVAGGAVQMEMATATLAIPLVKGGKAKAFMVTLPQHQPFLPDVPGLDEVGVKGLDGLEPNTFYGWVGPPGMPPAVVSRLNDALNAISKNKDVVARDRDALFIEPANGTPAAFHTYVEKELDKWRQIAKAENLNLTQ